MAEKEDNIIAEKKKAGTTSLSFYDTVLLVTVISFLIIMFIGLCGYFHISLISA